MVRALSRIAFVATLALSMNHGSGVAHGQDATPDPGKRFAEAFRDYEAALDQEDDATTLFLDVAERFLAVAEVEGVEPEMRFQALFNAALALEQGKAIERALEAYTLATHAECPQGCEEELQLAMQQELQLAMQRIAELQTRRLHFVDAGIAYEALIARFPDHADASEHLARAAELARLDEDWALASERYLRYYDHYSTAVDAPNMLFAGANTALKGGDEKRARKIFERFRKSFGKTSEQVGLVAQSYAIEASAAMAQSDEKRARKLWKRLAGLKGAPELQARAGFELAELDAQSFDMPLTAATAAAYHKRFEQAQSELAVLAQNYKDVVQAYPESEWAVGSVIRMAEHYHGFAIALRSATCPEKLAEAKCEGFLEQLRIAADEVDKRFARPYFEQVVGITKSGVSTPWTERARSGLNTMDPEAYPKLPEGNTPLLPSVFSAAPEVK